MSTFRRSLERFLISGKRLAVSDSEEIMTLDTNATTLRLKLVLLNMGPKSRIVYRDFAFTTSTGPVSCLRTGPIFISDRASA